MAPTAVVLFGSKELEDLLRRVVEGAVPKTAPFLQTLQGRNIQILHE
jgi:hypothetical protein